MSGHHSHKGYTMYVYVNKDAQPLPGLGAGYDAALMYHAMADCGYGIPCPPYVQGKELTCVMCTEESTTTRNRQYQQTAVCNSSKN